LSKIKVAVVGCGNVSESYLPDLILSEYTEIVALCDSKAERVKAMAEKHGIDRCYTEFDQMLQGVQFDLMVNLTSMNLHAPFNKKALEQGIHVWCEKPVATDLAAAHELLDISRRTGAQLYCAPNAPASPAFRFMSECISSGKLGKVTAANGVYGWSGPEWGAWFYRKGGGVLFDLGVYNITTLTGLLGPAKSVIAMSGIAIAERKVHDEENPIQAEADDNVAIIIDHGNAVYSTIQTGFVYAAQREDWTIQLIGTEGAMTMQGYDWEPKGVNLYTKESSKWELHALDQKGYSWAGGASYIAECLATGKKPMLQAEHAIHVLEIMQAAEESAKTGRRIEISAEFAYPLIFN
jgi:predicted dehydrogenase